MQMNLFGKEDSGEKLSQACLAAHKVVTPDTEVKKKILQNTVIVFRPVYLNCAHTVS